MANNFFIIIIFFIILISLNSQNVFGHGVIDKQTNPFSSIGIFTISNSLGQQFKPSQTNLIGIDILFSDTASRFSSDDYKLVINIREDTIGGPIIGTAEKEMLFGITRGGPNSAAEEIHLDFSPTVFPLVPDELYVIQAETINLRSEEETNSGFWHLGGDDVEGTLIVAGSPGSSGNDFEFRTYYDPDFVPNPDQQKIIGGKIIPIEFTSLLISSIYSSPFLFPILFLVGTIGFFLIRKN